MSEYDDNYSTSMFRATGYQGVLLCATYFPFKLTVTQILGLVFMEGTMSCDHLSDLYTSWQAHIDTFPNMSEAASGLVSRPKAQSYLEKRGNSSSVRHLQKSSNFRRKKRRPNYFQFCIYAWPRTTSQPSNSCTQSRTMQQEVTIFFLSILSS